MVFVRRLLISWAVSKDNNPRPTADWLVTTMILRPSSWLYLRVTCHHNFIFSLLVVGDKTSIYRPLNTTIHSFSRFGLWSNGIGVYPDHVSRGSDGHAMLVGSLVYMEGHDFQVVPIPDSNPISISTFCPGLIFFN